MTETTSFDPARFKANAHQEWQIAAPGWQTWSETMETEEGSRALSRILADRARLRAGDTVLDVGAGYGEPGLTVAQAIAPGGRLVLQDLAADMLAYARQRMEAAGSRVAGSGHPRRPGAAATAQGPAEPLRARRSRAAGRPRR